MAVDLFCYSSLPVKHADKLLSSLTATSMFMISLNDKSAADLVQTVLYFIRAVFGSENVIVMSDGELR
jgi:hypothetical protein